MDHKGHAAEKVLRKFREKGMLKDELLVNLLELTNEHEQSSSDPQNRRNVLTVRITDEAARCLDDLVAVKIAQSRSEAANMLIVEGIKARSALFEEIKKHTQEIEMIQNKLKNTIQDSGLGTFDE